MKILILGGAGMLGSALSQYFLARHETWVAVRSTSMPSALPVHLAADRVLFGVDAEQTQTVARALAAVRPDAVLNAIGIIKQLPIASRAVPSIQVNALFPHLLADMCAQHSARMVHFSTDCVFSGRQGSYRESDIPDPVDLYGRSKLLGEISDRSNVITLRSSIIGREHGTAHSLVDWFLSQRDKSVRGFTRAVYSGITTLEMARVAERVLADAHFHGLWHVASVPITKFDLLHLLRAAFAINVEIIPDDKIVCDRSLCADAFEKAAHYTPPSWKDMTMELAQLA